MNLKGAPLFLLIGAIGLTGAVFWIESRKPDAHSLPQASIKPLFNFQEADVLSFTLETPEQTLAFQKSGSGNTMRWEIVTPQPGPAEEGAIAYLLNLMATGKNQQSFQIPYSRRSEFGFDRPLATVKATLANQQTETLVLGKPTFDRTALYALVNPLTSQNQDLTVHLVSTDFANAVTRPLSEWQQAPSPKKK